MSSGGAGRRRVLRADGRADWGPRGQFGAWPGCGCGSLIMILAVILLVCGGCVSLFEGGFRY